jgi:predicted SnoaL-like aldol condensation-catalyzing enzyme
MSTSENKAVLRRWFEAWNTRSVSTLEALVDETFAVDFVAHMGAQPAAKMGREGMKQFVRDVLKNTPDFQLTVEDMIAEGNRVAVRYTPAGTDTSTGKFTRTLVIQICRMVGDKMAEVWGVDVPAVPQG